MRFVTMTYSRIVSDGDYGNRRLEATISLDENDVPEREVVLLRAFVDTQLSIYAPPINLPRADPRLDPDWEEEDDFPEDIPF